METVARRTRGMSMQPPGVTAARWRRLRHSGLPGDLEAYRQSLSVLKQLTGGFGEYGAAERLA